MARIIRVNIEAKYIVSQSDEEVALVSLLNQFREIWEFDQITTEHFIFDFSFIELVGNSFLEELRSSIDKSIFTTARLINTDSVLEVAPSGITTLVENILDAEAEYLGLILLAKESGQFVVPALYLFVD